MREWESNENHVKLKKSCVIDRKLLCFYFVNYCIWKASNTIIWGAISYKVYLLGIIWTCIVYNIYDIKSRVYYIQRYLNMLSTIWFLKKSSVLNNETKFSQVWLFKNKASQVDWNWNYLLILTWYYTFNTRRITLMSLKLKL